LHGRLIAAGALAVAVVAIAVVLLGGGAPYTLRLELSDAGQLVNGNLVTVGGLKVGTVKSIELTADAQAVVEIAITDTDFDPLHEGTSATVRVSSLSSVANRVVSLEPGPNNAPELELGATIPADLTSTPVEIDQLVSALDAQTRTSLQQFIHGSADIYDGKAREANATLAALNPAIGETAKTLEQLNADQDAFTNAIVESASLMTTVAGERESLDGMLTGAAQLTGSLARRTRSISGVLETAPQGLRDFQDVIDRYRTVFRRLEPQAGKLSAVTPLVGETVTRLRPTLETARTALPDVRAVVGSLATTLQRLPGLRDAGVPALNATRTALRDAVPILRGVLPYLPDVFHGLVGGFGGQIGGGYDANGAYVRIRPELGSAALTGGLGSLLEPLLSMVQPRYDPNRCPGGAAATAPDGSSPFEVASSECTNRGPEQ
jgi:phospholipid/cholesterol/gamma-HCH transport system substrate-binding protein